MFDRIRALFDTSGFPARWHCGDWSELHGWTHVLSDVAIFGAYLAIPCVLAFFVLRRRDVPFLPIFWLFAAFILSCGFGHLIEATIFWHPWYRLSALIKVCTALVSWATVIALVRVIPMALRLPGIVSKNVALEREVHERRRDDEALKDLAQRLEQENVELELFAGSILGREERVIALKEEVNGLLEELGRGPRYSRAMETEMQAPS